MLRITLGNISYKIFRYVSKWRFACKPFSWTPLKQVVVLSKSHKIWTNLSAWEPLTRCVKTSPAYRAGDTVNTQSFPCEFLSSTGEMALVSLRWAPWGSRCFLEPLLKVARLAFFFFALLYIVPVCVEVGSWWCFSFAQQQYSPQMDTKSTGLVKNLRLHFQNEKWRTLPPKHKLKSYRGWRRRDKVQEVSCISPSDLLSSLKWDLRVFWASGTACQFKHLLNGRSNCE